MNKFIFIATLAVFGVGILFPRIIFAQERDIVFPVYGPSSFRDDFGEPRAGHVHEGIDIVADKMTPVVSAVDGRVTYAPSTQPSWGYTITISDSEGYSYRYLHLNNDNPGTDDGQGGPEHAYASGIRRGVNVSKGQVIGWVGDSGNAENTVSHLHFEIRKNRVPINPYRSLRNSGSGGMYLFTRDESVSKVVVAIPKDYSLIKYANDSTVYLLWNNIKYRIANSQTLNALSSVFGKPTAIATVTTQYPSGSVISITPDINVNHAAEPGASLDAEEAAAGDLYEGLRSEEVRLLQLKLQALGYFSSSTTATGYFGPITKSAVIGFQIEHDLPGTGIVDQATKDALDKEGVAPVFTGSTYVFTRDLSFGSTGLDVLELQKILQQLGYFNNPYITNYFGSITKSAVISFQKARGIYPAAGYVGPITRAALNAL